MPATKLLLMIFPDCQSHPSPDQTRLSYQLGQDQWPCLYPDGNLPSELPIPISIQAGRCTYQFPFFRLCAISLSLKFCIKTTGGSAVRCPQSRLPHPPPSWSCWCLAASVSWKWQTTRRGSAQIDGESTPSSTFSTSAPTQALNWGTKSRAGYSFVEDIDEKRLPPILQTCKRTCRGFSIRNRASVTMNGSGLTVVTGCRQGQPQDNRLNVRTQGCPMAICQCLTKQENLHYLQKVKQRNKGHFLSKWVTRSMLQNMHNERRSSLENGVFCLSTDIDDDHAHRPHST